MQIRLNSKINTRKIQILAFVRPTNSPNCYYTKKKLYPIIYKDDSHICGVLDNDYSVNNCYVSGSSIQTIYKELDKSGLKYDVIHPKKIEIEKKKKTINVTL